MIASGERETRPRQYVAYYRVSTSKQGRSGLGLEAQRAAVSQFVARAPGKLVAEFTEVKSGSAHSRPQLDEALRICRIRGAILAIARLDRLGRNARLIATLMQSGLEFVATDFPHANRLTIHVLAAVAEYEAKTISDRVKAGLAAAKARGVKFPGHKGGCREHLPAATAASLLSRRRRVEARARDLAPLIWGLIAKGRSRAEIADELARDGVTAPRAGKWSPSTIDRIRRLTADEYASAPDVAMATKIGPRGFRRLEWAREAAPIVWSLRSQGKTIRAITDELNRQNIPSAKNRPWNVSAVWTVLSLTADEPSAISRPFVLVRSGLRMARARNRADEVAPLVWELRSKGQSHRMIASELNQQGIPSPGNARWRHGAVARVMRYTRHEFALIAEEFRSIRDRTLMDLANAKARAVAPPIWRLVAEGHSPRAIAEELNRRCIPSVGNRGWHASTVRRVLQRTEGEFVGMPDIAEALDLGPQRFRARVRAMELAPIISELRTSGLSVSAIAAELNRRDVPTPKMRNWYASSVWRVVRRISATTALAVSKAPCNEE